MGDDPLGLPGRVPAPRPGLTGNVGQDDRSVHLESAGQVLG